MEFRHQLYEAAKALNALFDVVIDPLMLNTGLGALLAVLTLVTVSYALYRLVLVALGGGK